MSTDVAPPPASHERGAYTPTLGSFFGAELLRIRSRRFIQLAVVGLLAVFVLVAVINFLQSAKPSQSEVNQATSNCVVATDEEIVGESSDGGVVTQEAPSTPCTVRDAAQQGLFDKRPALTSDIPEEIIGVGVGVAVLGFILGCTLGGADWSHKTMVALLFWEPRRARVFLVKLAALLTTLIAVLFVAQLLWIAIKGGIVQAHGLGDVSTRSITDELLTNVGRSLVLVMTMGALAYGLASLIRNTGAALGIGFVYFAIVELFINGLLPRLAPFTLTINIGALFTPGGLHEEIGTRTVHISSLQGGLVLIAYATVICVIGLELFRRRDVS